MSTTLEFLQSLIPGIVSGAATAGGAVGSYLKGLLKRVEDLEKRMGTTDPVTGAKSGLVATLDALQSFQRRVESWEHQTPHWMVQMVQNAYHQVQMRSTMPSLDTSIIEGKIRFEMQGDLRSIRDQVHECQNTLENLQERVDRCLTVETSAMMERSMSELRADVAAAKGGIDVLGRQLSALTRLG